jgi:hypothetical protein
MGRECTQFSLVAPSHFLPLPYPHTSVPTPRSPPCSCSSAPPPPDLLLVPLSGQCMAPGQLPVPAQAGQLAQGPGRPRGGQAVPAPGGDRDPAPSSAAAKPGCRCQWWCCLGGLLWQRWAPGPRVRDDPQPPGPGCQWWARAHGPPRCQWRHRGGDGGPAPARPPRVHPPWQWLQRQAHDAPSVPRRAPPLPPRAPPPPAGPGVGGAPRGGGPGAPGTLGPRHHTTTQARQPRGAYHPRVLQAAAPG